MVRRGLRASAALGVALAALFVAARLLRPPPLGVTADSDHHPIGVGDWLRVRNSAVPLNFSDGTSITLDPGSRARLEAVDAAGARLTIEAGHADVKVVPGRDGRWHLSLGPFGVDVTGTQFDIGWNPDAEELSLTMREGKVMVSGCVLGDGRPLAAGERLTASCRDRRFEVARAKPLVADGSPPASSNATTPSSASISSAPVAPGPAPLAVLGARSDPAPHAAGSRPHGALEVSPASEPEADSWRALARAGKYKLAFDAANAAGFELELGRSSAEELSLLGDVARFGGNSEAAIKAYQTLRQRFPRSPLSANAAFAIGRIQFDQRGAFTAAERWFGSYLAEAPRGALAREALGRRMEALERSGNHDGAVNLARSYQQSYPRGPHIRLARQLLETP